MYLCIRLKISTKFMPQNLCIDQFDARTEWRCDFATAIKQFTKYFVKTVYRMAKNVSSDFQRLLVFPIERYSCLTALDILSIRKHLQPLKVTLDVYLPFYNIVLMNDFVERAVFFNGRSTYKLKRANLARDLQVFFLI